VIKPVGGGKYVVYSESGKPMSKPVSLGAAKKRLAMIEWFRDKGKK
jgi:hypothetical protein